MSVGESGSRGCGGEVCPPEGVLVDLGGGEFPASAGCWVEGPGEPGTCLQRWETPAEHGCPWAQPPWGPPGGASEFHFTRPGATLCRGCYVCLL